MFPREEENVKKQIFLYSIAINILTHHRKVFCQSGQSKAVPWLRRLVAGLSPWRPRFMLRSRHVGFVVDKVTLG
jgi:hypothetical protein